MCVILCAELLFGLSARRTSLSMPISGTHCDLSFSITAFSVNSIVLYIQLNLVVLLALYTVQQIGVI